MMLRSVLFGLGVFTLVAAAVLAVLWLRMPSSPAPTGPQSAGLPSAILVAAVDVPAGTLLRPSDLRWQKIAPTAVMPTDLVRGQVSEGTYYGAVTRTPISEGHPLRASEVVLSGNRDFLAAVLSPGMRALSLAVDESQSVSGLLQPQDRVDVVLTRATNGTNGVTSAVGETVLRNVRVVAVDQWFGQAAKTAATESRFGPNQTATTPKEVTLELDDADAKRLLVATQLGRVNLVLRALDSSGATTIPVADEPVWDSGAYGTRSSAVEPSAPVRSEKSETVEVIRGSKTSATAAIPTP
jgi:pilus assembly protein CpaB